MVMMLVPSRARWSMRRSISSSGTGSETLSYSLQYAQERLQKRMGTICAMTGCRVEATAWPTIPISRSLRVKALRGDLLRRLTGGVGVTVDMEGSHDYSLQPGRDAYVWGEASCGKRESVSQ